MRWARNGHIMPHSRPKLKLKGFDFEALFCSKGLYDLDVQFIKQLEQQDVTLSAQLIEYRRNAGVADPKQLSAFLLALAPKIEAFIIDLFDIADAAHGLAQVIIDQDPIFAFKHHFVLRLAKRLLKKSETLPSFDELDRWLHEQLPEVDDCELAVAQLAQSWLADTAQHTDDIERLSQWCAQVMLTKPEALRQWVSFRLPQKIDFEHLVPVEPVPNDPIGRLQGLPQNYRLRDGFGLTDPRMTEREVLNEIDYCVYCHTNDGDFCSQGFPVKKNNPELGLKVNPLGDALTGCPLDEKISEMHTLKKVGQSIAALAMVMRDNPMCPATGHRICNDCMKACIYQKQTPVDIPQVETRILTDVLTLPWGVEIYDLLTRWNPLRYDQYVMQPYNGNKVLVMGMGPAGFTMAHHLLMSGAAVVGADGLKIEPLDPKLISEPIYDYQQLEEALDERLMTGFGGVAEYGITVRWDKNFLKLIYIALMRRPYFQVLGGVRFGGTITIDQAWQLGFNHITIAVGAGLPKELHIPNSLAPGMRQANDFLMALQLTGAAKEQSLANLQVRLPAVVIGGGLTGVDAATEVQAYYIKQVEKTLFRYETLCQQQGEAQVRAVFSAQDLLVLDEFCAHGREVRQLRAAQSRPDFLPLIRKWGGVTIVYRRRMQDSPAYQRNYEELSKALEEGIYYAEGLEPTAVMVDESGYCASLQCILRVQDHDGQWIKTEVTRTLPARSIFVATGAKPNVAYAFEHKDDISRVKFEYPRFQVSAGALQPVTENGHVKMDEFGAFTSYARDGRFVSFIGDTHPVFHGSVVKAIASAKRSYPRVVAALPTIQARDDYVAFHDMICAQFNMTVATVEPLDKAVKLTIHAPQLSQVFRPGQFYRLQNYETDADNCFAAEGVAALGFKQKPDSDQLSFILFDRGVSSNILMQSKVGQRLAVMGPTGVRCHVPTIPQHILIVGDQFAIPYLLSVGPALKAAGCTLYFVLIDSVFICRDEVMQIADSIVEISSPAALALDILNTLDEVHVIGYANLLREVQKLRATTWKSHLKSTTSFKASVYGPMQCMLKGVCAQCLQWQIDPKTGQRTKAVYACSWQHQPMELIDINALDERLLQNHMQETLTRLWYKTL